MPSRIMVSTLSMTSSRAWGMLQGRRDAYCTRPPQLCRAPTMSWLMFTSIRRGLFRVLAEDLLLARELVHPPEADVAAGTSDLALLDEPRQGPADLQEVAAAAAVVVGGRHLLLDVGGEDDLLIADLAALDPGLDVGLLALLRPARLHVHLHLEGLRGRLELARQTAATPRRDQEGEAAGGAVRDTVDALGRAVDLLPGHLLGRIDEVGPVGGVGHDAYGPALEDGLLVDGAGPAGGEHDLALHVLPLVVRPRPRPRPRPRAPRSRERCGSRRRWRRRPPCSRRACARRARAATARRSGRTTSGRDRPGARASRPRGRPPRRPSGSTPRPRRSRRCRPCGGSGSAIARSRTHGRPRARSRGPGTGPRAGTARSGPGPRWAGQQDRRRQDKRREGTWTSRSPPEGLIT